MLFKIGLEVFKFGSRAIHFRSRLSFGPINELAYIAKNMIRIAKGMLMTEIRIDINEIRPLFFVFGNPPPSVLLYPENVPEQ